MEFKPERFNRDNSEKRDSFAFCPFSAGPRFVVFLFYCFDMVFNTSLIDDSKVGHY